MRNIHMLVILVMIAVAASTAGLNVTQVAYAQSKGTCVVNSDTTVANNVNNGNPHCFDPEQQPPTASNPAGGTSPPESPGTCPSPGDPSCGNHPQSLNPVVGNPHEETTENGGTLNPQGDVVGSPHYPAR